MASFRPLSPAPADPPILRRRPSAVPRRLFFSAVSSSSAAASRWRLADSLHSHAFPFGSEAPEPDADSRIAFSVPAAAILSPVVDRQAEELEILHRSFTFQRPADVIPPILVEDYFRQLYCKDPPWFPFPLLPAVDEKEEKRRKYNELRRRQVRAETEAWERTAAEYREMQRKMLEKKLAPHVPFVQSLMLGWFAPLRDAIEEEQRMWADRGGVRPTYATHIGLLPADKMAVIVMHKMMGLLMTDSENRCVRLVKAAILIGDAVECEVRIHNVLEKSKKKSRKRGVKEDASVSDEQAIVRRSRLKNLLDRRNVRGVHKLIKSRDGEDGWGRNAQVRLGSRLIEMMLETAFVQDPADQSGEDVPAVRPAFRHSFRCMIPGKWKSWQMYGVIECDPLIHTSLWNSGSSLLIPYMPMLIPPKKWRGYKNGGHLYLPSYVMRTHGSRIQREAIQRAPAKQLGKVFEALNTLGKTRWRINKRVLSVVEDIWSKGGSLAGMIDRTDVPIPEKPDTEDASEIRKFSWLRKKAKKENNERHALRCDTELKLLVAREMRDEDGFYYPHSLDFRGRAYPMHPHLNHLNSDLCRGVLEFAEGRPLGKSGLRWLKIQLANLYAGGVEKLSLDDRIAFVEDNMTCILDSVDRPLDGERWWLGAEDPFQCLAACINLSEALRSSSPHHVLSHIPIHQDGSCNGLQHYAALARNNIEAAAVNLVASDKPADVYSGIAARVLDYIKVDSEKDPSTHPNTLFAKLLVDQVDRKLVKQTVMTSVYGVTFVGARDQIRRRLEERGLTIDDQMLFKISNYASKITMLVLEEMFQGARGIMNWLANCAKVIASENQPVRWTTPLGLPVVQPYMKPHYSSVATSLQVLRLQCEGDSVEVKHQKTAFPPNFIHSLDGSHMMMTAIACKDAKLHFAGVHDSFWTHACDVDKMNLILREQFVKLYDMPILENLLESFTTSFPTLSFPPLPHRGDFDIKLVLDSPYFFN